MSRHLPCTAGRHARAPLAAVALLAPLLLVLPGCATHYAPVLVPTLECKLPDTLLAACEAPGAITQDMTYGQVIQLAQADRQKLARCSLLQRDLATAVRSCNQAIAQHNAELERSNEAQRKQAR